MPRKAQGVTGRFDSLRGVSAAFLAGGAAVHCLDAKLVHEGPVGAACENAVEKAEHCYLWSFSPSAHIA